LATAAEFRDEQTGNHVLRVAHSSRLIADALGQSRQFVENLFLAAPLHDLGKIGIPDSILHKPSRLSEAERRIVQTHCEIGERILGNPGHLQRQFLFHRRLPAESLEFVDPDPVLQMAKEIAAAHHERWDGHGYPRGLSGEQIPLAARIVAIADVYDALTSARPYKPAFSAEESRQALRLESGRHFDPVVHAAFESCWLQIEEIRSHLPEAVSTARCPDAFMEFPGVAAAMETSLVASASAESGTISGIPCPAAD
jgi:putative two-component system response regulator